MTDVYTEDHRTTVLQDIDQGSGTLPAITFVSTGKEARTEIRPEEVRWRILHKALPLHIGTLVKPRVGGWWTEAHETAVGTTVGNEHLHWFAEEKDLEVLPCVVAGPKGFTAPAGASSLTVELIGALILVQLRTDQAQGSIGDFGAAMAGAADSMGATYVVSKLYSAAEPSTSIVMALTDHCLAHDILPTVDWRRREANQWADDLSKMKTEGFDPAKRHKVDWSRLKAIQDFHEAFALRTRQP